MWINEDLTKMRADLQVLKEALRQAGAQITNLETLIVHIVQLRNEDQKAKDHKE